MTIEEMVEGLSQVIRSMYLDMSQAFPSGYDYEEEIQLLKKIRDEIEINATRTGSWQHTDSRTGKPYDPTRT